MQQSCKNLCPKPTYTVAHKHVARKQERRAEMYNKKVHGKPHQVGTLVWVLNPQVPRGKTEKLYRWWTGPYKVIKRISDATYRVQHINNKTRRIVVHFDRLKRCQPNTRLDYKATTRGPAVPSQESPHQLGTNLQMAEESDEDETVGISSPRTHPPAVVPQPTNRRYPSRVRRPLDRLTVGIQDVFQREGSCVRVSMDYVTLNSLHYSYVILE